jgi:hypothetical protein
MRSRGGLVAVRLFDTRLVRGLTMVKPRHPPGDPMTLGNMRKLGVHHLIASCLNEACPHQAVVQATQG